MAKNEKLLKENCILHQMISIEIGEFSKDEIARMWKGWAEVSNQNSVNKTLRSILGAMFIRDNVCTKENAQEYINKLLKEGVKK